MKSTRLIISLLLLSGTAFAKEATPTTATQETAFQDPFTADGGALKPRISDPMERMNRTFFHFNYKVYLWVLRPVSKGYRTIAPKSLRESVDRLFVNVEFPVRLVNNVLEARFKGAGIETARFVVNSTVGVGGLLDPATHWKIKAQPASFDQTLAIYGVPTGSYLVCPFLGASSVRGGVGLAGDAALDPTWYFDVSFAWTAGAVSLETVNATSLHIEEYDDFMSATLDPYAARRSVYFESESNITKR